MINTKKEKRQPPFQPLSVDRDKTAFIYTCKYAFTYSHRQNI